jgi:hypothetical protein
LLTNANISKEIKSLLYSNWLNDSFVDVALYNLIKQNDNLSIKLRAIGEYNKLAKRYDIWIVKPVDDTKKIQDPVTDKDLDELLSEFYD